MKKLFIVIFSVIIMISVTGCHNSVIVEWKRQFYEGKKYAEKYNYINAISAFEKAIEIDPSKPEGYIELADAYKHQDRTEMAHRTLLRGVENIGADSMKLLESFVAMGFDPPKSQPELAGMKVGFRDSYRGNVIFLYDDKGCLIKKTHSRDGSYSEYEYNSNGEITKSTSYGYDGRVILWEEYSYNKKENETRLTRYDEDGNVTICYDKIYNEDGKVIRSKYYSGEGKLQKIFEYDEYGNDISCTAYEDGEIAWGYRSEYNEYGLISSTVHYDADNKVTGSEITEYDDDGNTARFTKYNADGSISWYSEYCGYENLLKNVEYNLNEKIAKSVSDHSLKDGSYKKTYYDTDDDVISVSEYDKKGRIARETEYDKEGNVVFVYKYDEFGRRIRKTEYNSDGEVVNDEKYTYGLYEGIGSW